MEAFHELLWDRGRLACRAVALSEGWSAARTKLLQRGNASAAMGLRAGVRLCENSNSVRPRPSFSSFVLEISKKNRGRGTKDEDEDDNRIPFHTHSGVPGLRSAARSRRRKNTKLRAELGQEVERIRSYKNDHGQEEDCS